METAEIIRNSEDVFFYVPIHEILNIYYGQPITS